MLRLPSDGIWRTYGMLRMEPGLAMCMANPLQYRLYYSSRKQTKKGISTLSNFILGKLFWELKTNIPILMILESDTIVHI